MHSFYICFVDSKRFDPETSGMIMRSILTQVLNQSISCDVWLTQVLNQSMSCDSILTQFVNQSISCDVWWLFLIQVFLV